LTRDYTSQATPAIAIVGMGCWYPGARDLRQFWENVLARRRQFRHFPAQRLPLSEYHDPAPRAPDKTYATRGAFIDGFEFDWVGRRIPKQTFEATDVVHWLALEIALSALADSGRSAETLPAERTAVIVGNTLTGEQTRSGILRLRWPYVRKSLRAAAEAKGLPSTLAEELEGPMEELFKSVFPPVTEDTLAGVLANTIPGRICNFLDLKGGGYTVDGACCSGMIAVATAAGQLHAGDTDFALAGGVDVSLDAMELIGFAKVGALTRDDMNVYDRRGSGFIPGEGCGFVALKRLEDARRDGDYVYAVIRGWGISSDGSGGITAPSREAQALMVRRAYERAGYSPHELAFVEGHGTATVVGDLTELEAIQLALESDGEPQPRACGMTSFKSLIGHTKAASGIAGLIKATMAVNRRVVPPTAGCKDPNKAFGKAARGLYPVLWGEVREGGEVMRAGASAMGFGGINCHIALESGDAPAASLEPSADERGLLASGQDTELFLLGAGSIPELRDAARGLEAVAGGMSVAELTDLAAQLVHQTAGQVRAAIVAGRPEELEQRLAALGRLLDDSPPAKGELAADAPNGVQAGNAARAARVAFLFPGQGSQQLAMGRELVGRYAWARELAEQADHWLREAGYPPVGELVFRPVERALDRAQLDGWNAALAQTEVAQPAICLASLLWLRRLEDMGLRPNAVAGHSLGELTAFHAAGVFDARALILLAATRGRAMAAPAEAAGTMASLACSRQDAEELLARVSGYAVVANLNSPRQTVISGERASVEEALELAAAAEIKAVELKVSNAFHSELVAGAAEALRNGAPVPEKGAEPSVPLFSGIDGRPVPPGVDLREHFARQVVSRVDFVALVERLAGEVDLLLEVGPGRVLGGLAGAITGADGPRCLPLASEPGADRDLNAALASLYVRGADADWEKLYEGRLVRPFVPASELLFLDNPVERPQSLAAPVGPAAVDGQGAAPAGLAGAAGLSGAELSDYLTRRGEFLAGVIRADLGAPPLTEAARPAGAGELPAPGIAASGTALASAATAPRAAAAPDVEARLVALAGEQTGFPTDSIAAGARLLDDLNLDSIKAAELVAAAAREFGVGDRLDPAELPPDATLGSVAAAIVSLMPEGTGAAAPGRSAAEVLLAAVAERTGFPPESLSLELRLLDDLNLDSIKAAELVAEAAARLGAPDALDPAELAAATLDDVAQALRAATAGAPPSGRPPATRGPLGGPADAAFADRPSWVRDFVVEQREEPLPEAPARDSRPEAGEAVENASGTPPLAGAAALVLSELGETDVAETLAGALRARDAQARVATFAEGALVESGSFSHIVAVLPRSPAPGADPGEALERALARLRSVAAPPTEPRHQGPTTVTYLQFGGGFDPARAPAESIEQCCAAAFAASVHLERPDLRLRVVDAAPTADPVALAECVVGELQTGAAYSLAGYDERLVRRVPRPRVQEAAERTRRPLSWSPEDVFLVTGGAKGITAECALELATATGARMALVGSSPGPGDEGSEPGGGEIGRTLERFEQRGLQARYYRCDVSDRAAVTALVARVRAELGAVTGVIHGAGSNVPRRVEQAPLEAARKEVGPKVLGASALCEALQDAPPKLIVGFTSITGVTGMPGNAWYGFANESLDLILRRFAAANPETGAVCAAFSIWGEVGMGARLGAADQLARMGVAAIPTDEGVRRFLGLVESDPGHSQVVVAARLRGLDTWGREPGARPVADRFLEEVVHLEPGVEAVARARLGLDTDAYVADHVYNGTHLLPTTFGLEAMAQAVALALGRERLGPLRIDDVRLERPVVVDPESGARIEVRAEVLERESAGGELRVKAAVGAEQTGFTRDHFSATFVLDGEREAPVEEVQLPPSALDIRPAEDLYGRLLFQGARFQRIERVHVLDSEGCLFEAGEQDGDWLLGDPYLRDSLLQSAQLIVPRSVCLPVEIGSIEVFRPAASHGSRVGVARYEGRRDGHEHSRVTALDADGRVMQRLTGYRARIMDEREQNPSAEQLAEPGKRDAELLRRELSRRCEALQVTPPQASLDYLPGLHELSADERHRLELPLFEETLARLGGEAGNGGRGGDGAPVPAVEWLESGRPVPAGGNGVGVSLAHDDRACLCVAGPGAQGCDIAPVSPRSREDWTALVGAVGRPLLDRLAGDDGDADLDRAGTRVWAARETLRKAGNESAEELVVERRSGDAVLFRCGEQEVLTFPIELTHGPERVIGVLVRSANGSHSQRPPAAAPASAEGYDPTSYSLYLDRDEQTGQEAFCMRFPVTFREAANLSRSVYFSHYFTWMGKVRELACQPVYEPLAEQFASGHWGMVTNNSETRVIGPAHADDVIDVRLTLAAISGREASTQELHFDWRRVRPGGGLERVAWSKMRITWVAILDHGVVEVRPLPDYYQELMDRFSESGSGPSALPESAEPIELGPELRRVPPAPVNRALLREQVFETTLEEANLVGNIYFANYYLWQGRTRDHYFQELAPGLYRGTGEGGELRCLHSKVEHLREAMPFDRIGVRMSLEAVYERGARLQFDYFRVAPDGGREKLATGRQAAGWFVPAAADGWKLAPLPPAFAEALAEAAAREPGG
jgi:enediyne polyketide synthase